MWNPPSDQDLNELPRLYETDHVPLEEKIVGMHFFLGGCDWYAVEYGAEDRVFFGYANLGDDINAEWGYFGLDELLEVRTFQGVEVDRDLHWRPARACDVPKIR